MIYTAYGTATEMGENWLGAGDEYALDGPLYCGYWHDTETGLSQDPEPLLQPEPLDRGSTGIQSGIRAATTFMGMSATIRRQHGSDGRKSDHSRGYIGLRMVLHSTGNRSGRKRGRRRITSLGLDGRKA